MCRSRRATFLVGLMCLVLLTAAVSNSSQVSGSSSQDVRTTPEVPRSAAYHSSSMAGDPTDPDSLAIAFGEASQRRSCGLVRSDDGGTSWTSRMLVGPDGQFMPDGSCQDARGPYSYPHLAYTPDGTLLYLFMFWPDESGSHPKLYIMRSSDDGVTFTEPARVDPDSPEDADDYDPAVAVDAGTGRVHVVWTRFLSASGWIMAAYSDDGGQTFSTPVRINPSTEEFSDQPAVAVAPGGQVHVAYSEFTAWQASGGSVPANVKVVSSGDAGETFASPTTVGTAGAGCASVRTSGGPYCDDLHYHFLRDLLAITARHHGDVIVAWWDRVNAPAGGNNRIYVSALLGDTDSWTDPQIVGVPTGGEDHHQHRPSLSAAPDGRVDLSYYDLAPPDGQGVRRHRTYVASATEGTGFSSPRELTDVSWDATVGPPAPYSSEIAPVGRIGLLPTGSAIRAAWTDARHGTSDTGHQDIYFTAEPVGTVRLGGQDRFATAVRISRDRFPQDGTAGAVVLARADRFPDALAGIPLAIANDAPLLITSPDALHTSTERELTRVLAQGQTVFVLGGTAAISDQVVEQVEELGYDVQRIAGQTRVETAIEIARTLGDPDHLFVVTGYKFPDALAAGAAAPQVDAAILLTESGRKSDSTQAYLNERDGETLYAIGGQAVNPYANDADVAIAGAERTETARKVAEFFFDTPAMLGLARQGTTGTDSDLEFVDALTGGAHIAARGGPMLLTLSGSLPGHTEAYVCEHSDGILTGYIYGGTSAISEPVADQLSAAISGNGC